MRYLLCFLLSISCIHAQETPTEMAYNFYPESFIRVNDVLHSNQIIRDTDAPNSNIISDKLSHVIYVGDKEIIYEFSYEKTPHIMKTHTREYYSPKNSDDESSCDCDESRKTILFLNNEPEIKNIPSKNGSYIIKRGIMGKWNSEKLFYNKKDEITEYRFGNSVTKFDYKKKERAYKYYRADTLYNVNEEQTDLESYSVSLPYTPNVYKLVKLDRKNRIETLYSLRDTGGYVDTDNFSVTVSHFTYTKDNLPLKEQITEYELLSPHLETSKEGTSTYDMIINDITIIDKIKDQAVSKGVKEVTFSYNNKKVIDIKEQSNFYVFKYDKWVRESSSLTQNKITYRNNTELVQLYKNNTLDYEILTSYDTNKNIIEVQMFSFENGTKKLSERTKRELIYR